VNIYAFIPARGGSKRLKHKNILPIAGKPSIVWTIEAALKSKYINKKNLFVSSEDDKILSIAVEYTSIIRRPNYLSKDDVITNPVIKHAIRWLKYSKKIDIKDDDIVVILQANSPEIQSDMIDFLIDYVIENKLGQAHTVDKNMINNGAIHVITIKELYEYGKVSYNGVVVYHIIDVHGMDDLKQVEYKLKQRQEQI